MSARSVFQDGCGPSWQLTESHIANITIGTALDAVLFSNHSRQFSRDFILHHSLKIQQIRSALKPPLKPFNFCPIAQNPSFPPGLMAPVYKQWSDLGLLRTSIYIIYPVTDKTRTSLYAIFFYIYK